MCACHEENCCCEENITIMAEKFSGKFSFTKLFKEFACCLFVSDQVGNAATGSTNAGEFVWNLTLEHIYMIKTFYLQPEVMMTEEGSCPVCNKVFTRKSSLLNHIRNHSADKKYLCSYCQKGLFSC